MPTIDCPGGPIAGPEKTASDGAHGLSPASSIQNARKDAIEEADDEVIDAIEDDYECKSDCTLVMGSPLIVGVFRLKGPPRRAWWTFWVAFWCEGSISVTRSVQCRKSMDE